MSPRSRLGELEQAVLEVLWGLDAPASGREVHERLSGRDLAYTTVMTVLDRLARKGAADRDKQGRGYLYRPAVSEQEVCELAFERLLDDFFSRSPQKLLEYLRERRPANHAYNGNGSPHLDSALL